LYRNEVQASDQDETVIEAMDRIDRVLRHELAVGETPLQLELAPHRKLIQTRWRCYSLATAMI
jgi:hypothetical protein